MRAIALAFAALVFMALPAQADNKCRVILSDGPLADTASPEDEALYNRCLKRVGRPRACVYQCKLDGNVDRACYNRCIVYRGNARVK